MNLKLIFAASLIATFAAWYVCCLIPGRTPRGILRATFIALLCSPGIIIGHNDRIAWGLTNVGPDVMDLYIEKINPEDPTQYEIQGEWVDMEMESVMPRPKAAVTSVCLFARVSVSSMITVGNGYSATQKAARLRTIDAT